ncbi:ras and ef-hand domain-containing protein [Anaeramoeba flamelloides]|uniref:Ras and ef-hand domain-containing protein n=1 Tax=Anaeramoeba flamelloides TaxID=1746091 RepID=A0AAV8A186_9EUKA|nr:ras and ef-hand domain-containing protein [Anaeramoeba flamelloides]KAJ6243531.1 ras and ef-hand domain-containing protein [Anaeramoeba flamelloides]
MSTNQEYHHLVKLIVLGDTGVGKTSIILKYIENKFLLTVPSTIAVDFKFQVLNILNRKVRVQVWDTAGQEIFRGIVRNYYRRSHGVILIYDVVNKNSFDSLPSWFEEIEENCDHTNIVLTGNKYDLCQSRKVKIEEGAKLAEEHKSEYIEVSAKSGHNIQKMFEKLITKIVAQLIEEETEEEKEMFEKSFKKQESEKNKSILNENENETEKNNDDEIPKLNVINANPNKESNSGCC